MYMYICIYVCMCMCILLQYHYNTPTLLLQYTPKHQESCSSTAMLLEYIGIRYTRSGRCPISSAIGGFFAKGKEGVRSLPLYGDEF